jgi:plastocyanin
MNMNDRMPTSGKVMISCLGIALMVLVVSCKSSGTTAPTTTTVATTTSKATTTTTATTVSGQTVTINLAAQNIAFDQSTITVPAGASVTVVFNNKEGIPHNFAVYTDSSATKSIFIGATVTGPTTKIYTFTAPATPGNYFFRCDIHALQMTGKFVVTQ